MRDMPNLDFLRSVAVISVVLEHTLLAMQIPRVGIFQVAWLGVVGVMVFFVLTALVLMWSLERKPHTLDFYIRRWFRIYPLALLAIGIALIFHAPTAGTATSFFAYSHPGLRDLSIQSTLLLASYRPLLTVMWSLPYEVGMYALLPALFFFVQKNFAIWPMLVIWVVFVANGKSVPAEGHKFEVAIAYFLPGIMAYIGYGRWKARFPGFLLPIYLVVLWAGIMVRPNFHRMWLFCLALGLALPLFRQMTSPLVLAASRVIARYSYGIYLMHPFAIVIAFYLLPHASLFVKLAVELSGVIVFPFLAYHLIEHPCIRLGARLAARAEAKYEQREMAQYRELPGEA